MHMNLGASLPGRDIIIFKKCKTAGKSFGRWKKVFFRSPENGIPELGRRAFLNLIRWRYYVCTFFQFVLV
jgi:hypothetical protein